MSELRKARRSRGRQLGPDAIRRLDRRRDAVKRFQFLALEDTQYLLTVEEEPSPRRKASRPCSDRQRRERPLDFMITPSDSVSGKKKKERVQKRAMQNYITGPRKAFFIDLTKDSDSEASDLAISDLAMRDRKDTTPTYCGKCIYMRCICKKEDIRLQEAFKREEAQVISYIPESSIYLRGASFRRLQGSRWLDDEIINCFVGMINARNKRIHACLVPLSLPNTHQRTPRTFMFNSFFYTVLCQGKNGFNYNGAHRWTRRAKLDVTAYDLILVPIHATNNHWVLANIDMVRREFGYLDSMKNRDKLGVVPRLKQWLQAELTREKGAAVAEEMLVRKWRTLENTYTTYGSNESHKTPSQTDDSSCGIFMLTFANCLSMGAKMGFSQTDIPVLRKKIALHLLRGYLPSLRIINSVMPSLP